MLLDMALAELLLANNLSICILTFNRPYAVIELLDQIYELRQPIPIYILDDGSTSPVQLRAIDTVDPRNTKLIKNSTNLGYARNFVKLFSVVETEYVVVLADDDKFIAGNFERLVSELSWFGAGFVITPFLNQKKKVRPRSDSRNISLHNFLDFSTHAPGLIYNRNVVLKYLPLLEVQLDNRNAFALTYPQCMLFFFALKEGEVFKYVDFDLVTQGANFPSKIQDSSGFWYGQFESRLSQFSGLLSVIRETSGEESNRRVVEHVQIHYMSQLLKQLKFEVRMEAISQVNTGRLLVFYKRLLRRIKKLLATFDV